MKIGIIGAGFVGVGPIDPLAVDIKGRSAINVDAFANAHIKADFLRDVFAAHVFVKPVYITLIVRNFHEVIINNVVRSLAEAYSHSDWVANNLSA